MGPVTRDAHKVIADALLASVLCDPAEPGLTHTELEQIGSRYGLLPGETRDAIAARRISSSRRYVPEQHRAEIDLTWWTEPDDLRSIEAFDFLYSEIDHAARSMGARAVRIPLETLLTRATAAGLNEHDVHVAVACHVLASKLVLTDDTIVPRDVHSFVGHLRKPSQLLQHNTAHHDRSRDKWSSEFRRVLEITRDVVARRRDGRPRSAEPIEAFGRLLPSLGHAGYEVWWRQMAAELLRLNPAETPTSYTVLSAALVEAALVFVCSTARERGLALLDDATFQKGPKHWSIEQLIRGAKKSTRPIFDDAIGRRAERVKLLRQRIHAGRFLAENVTPAQLDLRPEEARESRDSLDVILRAIMDWLAATNPTRPA